MGLGLGAGGELGVLLPRALRLTTDPMPRGEPSSSDARYVGCLRLTSMYSVYGKGPTYVSAALCE